MKNLSLDLFCKTPEPFQFPYFRIHWNGSCYLEDTVECKTVNVSVEVRNGWNSFIFEVIDIFDIFDPLDNSVIAQTDYDILDLKIDGINSWPVKNSNQKFLSNVKFHSDHMTWFSDRSTNATIQGKTKQYCQGKGFSEIYFYFDGEVITDHYYSGRQSISIYNYLSLEHIKADSFSKNLLGLSNLRLKELYTVSNRSDSTYEQHWGGLNFEVTNDCSFKNNLPQWISTRPWPFRWIHASYYNKHLPIELAKEFFQ